MAKCFGVEDIDAVVSWMISCFVGLTTDQHTEEIAAHMCDFAATHEL